jgi:hypothetical protein
MRSTWKAYLGLGPALLLTVLANAEEKQLPNEAKTILNKVSEVTFVSLEPSEKADKDNALYGWKVLGKTTLTDDDGRKKLLSTLEKSIAEPGNGGARCFIPRHAIQARHEGKAVDLLICFECGWVHVYLDGKQVGRIEMDTAGQELFDEVLRKAEVPLAKERTR